MQQAGLGDLIKAENARREDEIVRRGSTAMHFLLRRWQQTPPNTFSDTFLIDEVLLNIIDTMAMIASHEMSGGNDERRAFASVLRMVAHDAVATLRAGVEKQEKARAAHRETNKKKRRDGYWQPYQQYFELLIASGAKPMQARKLIADQIERKGDWHGVGRRPDDRTLMRWLKAQDEITPST